MHQSQLQKNKKKRSTRNMMRSLGSWFFILCIRSIRPLLGPARCNYQRSCTAFAINQLKTRSLGIALLRILFRVVSCNPFMAPRQSLE